MIMRKMLLVIGFAILTCSGQVKASNADLFELNENIVLNELASLSTLEAYVNYNEGVTFTQLSQTNSNLLITLNLTNLTAAGPTGMAFGFEDMQWGSFAWGFCCWPIGIFTVLLNSNKDTNHKISYFIGIGCAVILSIPGYFLQIYALNY